MQVAEIGYHLFHACMDEDNVDHRLNLYWSMTYFARLQLRAAERSDFNKECVSVARRLGLLNTACPALHAFVLATKQPTSVPVTLAKAESLR